MSKTKPKVKTAGYPYEPHGAARELFHCQAPEILIEGPAGTGKTRAILTKLHVCALKHPGCRLLILRKTRASCTESVLVTFEDKVLPEGCSMLDGAGRVNRQAYHYPNGSTIVIGGLDKAERLFSTEYDIVCVFEATEITESEWEKMHRSLRNDKVPYQQIIADCNPASPTNWLNQRANQGRMVRLLSRHKDNPTLTPKYLEMLSNLTGVRRARLYEGKWVAAEGSIWPEYDPAVHLINRFPIPDEWSRYRVVDFGYTNAFVCQWWAVDNDGRLYRYRELYHTKRTVATHAKLINVLSQGEEIEYTICDHDAEDRATLEEHDIPTIQAKKDVSVGLQVVTERLQLAGDGKARLYLLRDSLISRDAELSEAKQPCCTEEEIEGYLWKPVKEDVLPKEVPWKEHCPDHGCDAMRYMVMHFDSGPKPGIVGLDATPEECAAIDREERGGPDEHMSTENEELWERV